MYCLAVFGGGVLPARISLGLLTGMYCWWWCSSDIDAVPARISLGLLTGMYYLAVGGGVLLT